MIKPLSERPVSQAILDFYGDDEKKWTRGVLYLDASGLPTHINDLEQDQPFCACLMGACFLLGNGYYNKLSEELDLLSVSNFNDESPDFHTLMDSIRTGDIPDKYRWSK